MSKFCSTVQIRICLSRHLISHAERVFFTTLVMKNLKFFLDRSIRCISIEVRLTNIQLGFVGYAPLKFICGISLSGNIVGKLGQKRRAFRKFVQVFCGL